jgi:hypothetical protein
MTTNPSDKLTALNAELTRLKNADSFHRETFVARLALRVANPMPGDDLQRLNAELSAARADCENFSRNARAVQEEVDAIHAAERERRLAERSELIRAARINARKTDSAMRTAAKYEKALNEVRDRLVTYGDVDPAARFLARQHWHHYAALHWAELECDSSVPALSYVAQLESLLGKDAAL